MKLRTRIWEMRWFHVGQTCVFLSSSPWVWVPAAPSSWPDSGSAWSPPWPGREQNNMKPFHLLSCGKRKFAQQTLRSCVQISSWQKETKLICTCQKSICWEHFHIHAEKTSSCYTIAFSTPINITYKIWNTFMILIVCQTSCKNTIIIIIINNQ